MVEENDRFINKKSPIFLEIDREKPKNLGD